jgi:hypothetical protein
MGKKKKNVKKKNTSWEHTKTLKRFY